MSLQIALAGQDLPFEERAALSEAGGLAIAPKDLQAFCGSDGRLRGGNVATFLNRGGDPSRLFAMCPGGAPAGAAGLSRGISRTVAGQVSAAQASLEARRRRRAAAEIKRIDLPPRPTRNGMSLQMKAAKAGVPGVEAGFFGTLGNILTGGLKSVPGPIGGIAREIFDGGDRAPSRPPVGTPPTFPTRPRPPIGRSFPGLGAPRPPQEREVGGVKIGPVRIGGRMPGEFQEDGRGRMVGTKLACPSGFHPNKSSYFLKDGTFVPEGTRCVKNRRRNPLNPKALDRALRRVKSAKKATDMLKGMRLPKKFRDPC